MAIEGGCQWIQATNSLPEGTTMKEILTELKPLCEENEAFLMVDSDVELANEMRIHGVHLKKGDMKPAEARELLGPHAVIGVDAANATDIIALRGLDIDYVVLDFDSLGIAGIAAVIKEVKEAGVEIHFVACGDFSDDDFKALQNVGVNGFAVSSRITSASDPVAETAAIIDLLTH